MMLWRVASRLGGRQRHFNLQAPDLDTAIAKALHLISHWYADNSGALGNAVWREGKATIVSERGEKVVLYEATSSRSA